MSEPAYGPNREEFLAQAHWVMKAFMVQGLSGLLAQGGADGIRTREEADALLAQLDEDLKAKPLVHGILVRAWGRKPLAPPPSAS